MIVLTATIAPTSPAQADSIRNREWFLHTINAAKANQITEGAGLVVAVIDTGVDASHTDLIGSVLAGSDIFDKNSGKEIDIAGHGTLMAGLIAGHGHGPRGSSGVRGVAPFSKILPIRISATEVATSVALIEGIDWAVSHGAKVICLALSERTGTPRLQAAIESALRADVVVVAAVGNLPGSSDVEYPAAYPGVLAAAGTDERGRHAAVSVTGPEVVLSAPATNIVSTYKDGGYGMGTGTSNSTAIIAGAAALVRAKFPKLSAVEVIHRLTATAIDKGPPGRDDQYGYGIVNLIGALTAAVPPLTASPSPTPDLSSQPSASAGRSSRSIGWLLFAMGVVALLIVLAIWTTARRSAR